MADSTQPLPALTPPKQMSRHVFALLAVVSLAAAVGLWYWFNQTCVESLKLGAGLERLWNAIRAETPPDTNIAPFPSPASANN